VYTWCKVHVVKGMDKCQWVYHRPFFFGMRRAG
jgi:hypothetical protein